MNQPYSSVTRFVNASVCCAAMLFTQQAIGGEWFASSAMPTAREKLATCVVGNNIYAFGGAVDENSLGLQTSEVFDTNTEIWDQRMPMPTRRSYVTASAAGGNCYVFGGRSGFGNPGTNVNQRFSPGSNSWSTRAAMPTSRFGAASVTLGDRIYVVGGTSADNGPILATMESYHPQSNSWTSHPEMPTPRALLSAEVVDGLIYVIGGTRGPGTQYDDLEVYDPQSNQWTILEPMPTPRQGMATGVVNGRIYVAGGGTGATALDVVEEYDPASDQWTTRSPMGTGRVRLSGDVVDGNLYAIGGALSVVPPHPGQRTVERYQPPEVEAGLAINFGHIGSWYNPLTNGQGFNFDVIVDAQGNAVTMVVYAFTYDNAMAAVKFDGAEQRWFVAAGPIEGDTANMTLTLTTGGLFDDPNPTQTAVIGSMRFNAHSCTEGEVNMVIDQNVPAQDMLNVSIPVVRLSPDVMCESLATQ